MDHCIYCNHVTLAHCARCESPICDAHGEFLGDGVDDFTSVCEDKEYCKQLRGSE